MRLLVKLNLNDQLEDTSEVELPVGADDSHQQKILWWGTEHQLRIFFDRNGHRIDIEVYGLNC